MPNQYCAAHDLFTIFTWSYSFLKISKRTMPTIWNTKDFHRLSKARFSMTDLRPLNIDAILCHCITSRRTTFSSDAVALQRYVLTRQCSSIHFIAMPSYCIIRLCGTIPLLYEGGLPKADSLLHVTMPCFSIRIVWRYFTKPSRSPRCKSAATLENTMLCPKHCMMLLHIAIACCHTAKPKL